MPRAPLTFHRQGNLMKETPMTGTVKDVDEYLARVPEKERAVLQALRRTIRAAAPMAEETISYRIPAYKHHGPLVFFAAFADHLSFFGVSKPVIAQFRDEVAPFRTSSTTLHFSADRPLPASLVSRIVKARVAENEARQAAKRKK
jgi:uncharacterized protein YdhG (YjbR/CyaY superfamily)